jgi:hypothetical protein
VESRPNEIEGILGEPGVASSKEQKGAMQNGYGVLEHSRRHRHRSRSQRKRLKRLRRQALIVALSAAVIVLALLVWRYLVTD